MNIRFTTAFAALVVLAGCSTTTWRSGEVGNLPEEVALLAAPNQDITTARYNPDDNCYWYEHRGPVENTLIPLRTTGGNPICLATES